MEEFDINKVTAELLSDQMKGIVNVGRDFLKGSADNIQFSLRTIYTDYIKRVYDRYGKSKSFFIRDNPVELYNFYVPMGIKCEEIIINSSNLKGILNVNTHSIISGTGGAGKSIMLKHLFIDSLKQKKQIPVFIELRDLNNTRFSLIDLLVDTTNSFGLKIDKKFFFKGLDKGHFILFLDGLDEVNKNRKLALLKEIKYFTNKYPTIDILLTTRPDIMLSELDIFSTFNIIPLTLEQSLKLIKKLPADEELKSKFSKDLEGRLFTKHESFLSNPLLLSIMMLTYGYSADIPSKSSVFYNQAFEALFQRHDSFKGAYKRKRETKLDSLEFSRVFSTFCILTYEDRKFKFTKNEVLEYLVQAKDITCIDFEIENMYTDLLQAVSLLIEDGLSLYFTHRSFQEYFAAKFIVESNKEVKIELFNKYMKYANNDDVFELSREMDKEFVDFEVIQPFIEKFLNEIHLKKNIGITVYLKYLKIIWKKFEFKNGNLFGTPLSAEYREMIFFILQNVCPDLREKELSLIDQSEWVREQKSLSLKENLTTSYETKSLKTTDVIVKELYMNGILFSKQPLKVLIKINKVIKERKKCFEKRLKDLLLKR
ncbi:NACHT domain-containing protein [Ancylomarina euxinus]|uniref:NACHT domain-containing protein n=1 Tax=Ancylomarina euxinus TaxID=2283627 RepID=A0A425XZG9_9BACT|nr:NACHT domain-containing protein [Ancylomarina euxinus]MCZ4695516.1 NACHT domain-containing protein [Ancylomarina euxinus]MUP15666.1 NACHT domain-containing protein [Ancylomarina euxinus]RRG20659.1 NACHT domain-containing protein [Ancylomarina euxinus]